MTGIYKRVFLWHKDTDPYNEGRDERMNSAGYYEG
jgi:hypothetical protein